MTSSTWRLLETYDVSPEMAMGLDEVLLNGAQPSVGPEPRPSLEPSVPTLRLYTWSPDAVSLGYFQALDEVPAASSAPSVVRRLTGGGAIHHHGAELTFSIALGPGDHPAYAGSIPDSYELTHEAIMDALRSLGVPDVAMRRGASCASDLEGTGMCFHHSTAQDICWPGAEASKDLCKGVGTAQRRLRSPSGPRILHHGSIKVGGSTLEPEVATVRDHLSAATVPDVAAALKASISEAFRVNLVPDRPSPDELDQAHTLGARYSSPEFLNRRSRRGS